MQFLCDPWKSHQNKYCPLIVRLKAFPSKLKIVSFKACTVQTFLTLWTKCAIRLSLKTSYQFVISLSGYLKQLFSYSRFLFCFHHLANCFSRRTNCATQAFNCYYTLSSWYSEQPLFSFPFLYRLPVQGVSPFSCSNVLQNQIDFYERIVSEALALKAHRLERTCGFKGFKTSFERPLKINWNQK